MLKNINAELRKLFSIRSTYVVFIICIGLAVLFAFYGTGFRSHPADLQNPDLLASQVSNAISFLCTIGALVAVLLVTHEYRYNTIAYTITASRTRSQIIPAKIIAITVYGLVFSGFFAAAAPLLAYAGLQAHHAIYVKQTLQYGTLAWQALLAGWAFFMYAFIIASLIRNQVGALVTVFVFPGVVEQLLNLVFRSNSKYLPYHAITNVLTHVTMSSGRAAILVGVYIVAGWLVSWLLFLKRDAST